MQLLGARAVSVCFYFGKKKKKVFKIFRIFLTVFLMLDLFGFIFFLSVGLWGVLSQRGMMLLIQISFIMEVKSLLHIPGC